MSSSAPCAPSKRIRLPARRASVSTFQTGGLALPVDNVLIAEAVDIARQIGTFELSTRAREVCDLSGGRPVETAAAASRLRHGMRRLRPGLIDDALTTWESIPAGAWFPGVPLAPVTGPFPGADPETTAL